MDTKFSLIIEILKILLMFTALYVVPKVFKLLEPIKKYFEEKISAKQRLELIQFANIGIKIAEDYFKEKNKGKEKKNYVMRWLNKVGIKATNEQIDKIIDVIVDFYNTQGWNKEISKYLSKKESEKEDVI